MNEWRFIDQIFLINKFISRARGTIANLNRKPWLVWTDQCFCKTCESSFIEEDLDVIEHLLLDKIRPHELSSKFQNLRARNKKNIIKQNNWAIWSFQKFLQTDAYETNDIDKLAKNTFKDTKEFNTLDTLSAQSPTNYISYEENKQIYESTNPFSDKNARIDEDNIRYTKFAKSMTDDECDFKRGVAIDDHRSETPESTFSPLTIRLPFLKRKNKKVGSKSSSNTKRKSRKLKPIFIIEKSNK